MSVAYNCCSRGGPDSYVKNNGDRVNCPDEYRFKNWKNKTCDQELSSFCGEKTNLFGKTCREWISTFQPINGEGVANGSIDAAILSVCRKEENSHRPECACIVGADELRKQLPSASAIPVQCMLNDCSNNPIAFKTSSQLAPCAGTYCSISLKDIEVILGDKSKYTQKIIQSCGNKINKLSFSTDSLIKIEIFVLILLILLIFGIIIGLFIRKSK